MADVGFLLEDGFQVMAMATLSVFEFANIEIGRDAYRVTVLSETGGSMRSSLGPKIESTAFSAPPDTLLVVGELVPKSLPPAVARFIAKAGTESRRVAGICTGAYHLAEARLLDGRVATTHWAHAAKLAELYPAVRVEQDRIFVRDGNVWTSAGMSAGIDLALALVEQDHGAAVARSIARRLVVYYRRPGGQSQFSALLDLEPRSDRIQRALIYAKENLKEALSVEDLAGVANLSPRQFSRIFRSETGVSPAKAVERIRIEVAKSMIDDGRHPIEVVARETGFADRDRMRRAFLRTYGQPPQSLRRSIRLIEGSGASSGGDNVSNGRENDSRVGG
ncbi:Carnitine catabolism transcriptional activator [Hartmannibacter diazotrophicus]|uniref:Carnitine catabolism transcriptional activator n=1 Tax=Hartmannibacter diazotrophicus TaxID=1482074 RepID=A0A2C9DAB2_9HYPH|nr:GlxA family transcriptional regulator [Hartmannibacter diazotrophicus]SON56681.1 Carnitine catabolism transcriptional activator [Hartmannibacter diazotrophicus]